VYKRQGMSIIFKPLSTAGLKLYLQVWIVRFMGLREYLLALRGDLK